METQRTQKMLLKFHAGKKLVFVPSCFYLVAECVVQYSLVA